MQVQTWLRTDLQKGVEVEPIKGNLFSGDVQGNLIGVEVYDGGDAATLSGTVQGYVVRGDGATVVIANGTLNGNKASIVLTSDCYSVVGTISIVVKVDNVTVGACQGYVYRTSTDAIVDPGHVIPSLSELLAQIEACENATTAANTAATNANTKAGLADTAATNANTKAGLADTAAGNANTAAGNANTAAAKINNLTVSASGLATGATPTATVSDVDGHKNIAFGIPKGDTGETPNLTIGTVQTLNPDQSASATITGTAEAPVLNLAIPKGNTGSVDNVYGTTIPISESDSRTIKQVVDADRANAAKIITILTGTTNDSGYTINSGDYFESSGTLYKATAAIANGAAWAGSATAMSDGKTAVNALNDSITNIGNSLRESIEFFPAADSGNGGYIDFHFNGDLADFTSRLAEFESGKLTVEGKLQCTNGFLLSDGGSVDPKKTSEVATPDQALQGLSFLALNADGSPFPTSWVTLITLTSPQNYGNQIALPWFSTSSGQFAMRILDNGTWQNWQYFNAAT